MVGRRKQVSASSKVIMISGSPLWGNCRRRRRISFSPPPPLLIVLTILGYFHFRVVPTTTTLAAKVPFEVSTPAVMNCDDALIEESDGELVGCCPSAAASEPYVLPIGTEDYTEYRDYDESFFCNAELCSVISEYSLHVLGPAKVVCPERVSSDCRTSALVVASSDDIIGVANGTNATATTTANPELTFYDGKAMGDTLFIGGYDIDKTITYNIDRAELVTCSNRCEVKETSQQFRGYVELECDNDDDLPFECVEDGTNTTISSSDDNGKVVVDYYQTVRCPTKSCKVVEGTESITLVGPASVACDECYLDRNVPANATTITSEDNSTTTGIITTTTTTFTQIEYGEEMKCPNTCRVISNSTEVIGPALITCTSDISVEDDGQEGEVMTDETTATTAALWGCMEEDGTIVGGGDDDMTAPTTTEFEEFDNQRFFVDTSRRVRCDSKCDIRGSFVVHSPADIKCEGATFGCYSETQTWTTGSTETTLEMVEGEGVEVEIMARQVEGDIRCDANHCEVTKGDGMEVEGPAFVTCDEDTLGCEGVSLVSSDLGDTSGGKSYYQYQLNFTGRCDPECKITQHRTINGPTEVWCPKGESTTGTLGFACVGQGGQTGEPPDGDDDDDAVVYKLDCGEYALCNENCEIGGKKVGADPTPEEEEDPTSPTTGSSSSSASSPSPLIFPWWRILVVSSSSWNNTQSLLLWLLSVGAIGVAFF